MTVFTANWMHDTLPPTWKTHVIPRVRNIPRAKWIEIGCYEGRSALWTLENVLDPSSTITCVDTWCKFYESLFDPNLAAYHHRIVKLRGRSADVLPQLPSETFHGAYVDGSHEKNDVATDAREVWRLLLPGGVIVFDDYGNPEYPDLRKTVKNFLMNADRLKILYLGWQAIAIKQPDLLETVSPP